MDTVVMPANQVPSFRTSKAIERGVENNLLFTTWGGIGDQICSEPTLRFALDTFKNTKVSLATEFPELYEHLDFHKVYNLKNETPIWEQYLKFDTINNPDSLTWEFMSHMVTHCVDFPSLCSLRCTLPTNYKVVKLPVEIPQSSREHLRKYTDKKYVAIHAGRHWESKTFPASWWNLMLAELIKEGFIPVLFGRDTPEQGTVNVDKTGCVDLRDFTTLKESIWLLQRMQYLICNDSSPMHMAATGSAKIAFIASVKHQDYLYHWRNDEYLNPTWAYKMKHFNTGGVWDIIDYCPNKENTVNVDKLNQSQLVKWLPDPKEIIQWLY